jgi:hypothetical protein
MGKHASCHGVGTIYPHFHCDAQYATSGTTSLGFFNDDPANDNSNGLDNIVLVDEGPASTGVPEPASLVLFGTALVGLGVFRRRRNRA